MLLPVADDLEQPPLLEPASELSSSRENLSSTRRDSVGRVSLPELNDDDDDYDNDVTLLPSGDQTDLPELNFSEEGDIFENSLPEPDLPEGKEAKVI